jgi:hypothetical protein
MELPKLRPEVTMKHVSALFVAVAVTAFSVVTHPRAQDAQALRATDAPANAIWLDSLDLSKSAIRRPRGQRGGGPPPAPAPANPRPPEMPGMPSTRLIPPPAPARGNAPPTPITLMLGGVEYPHGVPLLVNGDLAVDLKGSATRFVSMIGIDDAQKAGQGSVTFDLWVDGKHAFDSGVIKSGEAPRQVSVDLTGAKQLILSVSDAGDGTRDDSADWGGAMLLLASGAQKPETAASAVSSQ